MGAIENVFGVGTKIDAAGNPIERGKGNLADMVARAAKIASDKAKVAAAAAKAAPEVAVSQTVAAQAAAVVVAAVAAPATVSPVVAPNVVAAPPAPAATPIPPAAPVATVAEKLAGVLHNVEAASQSDVKKVEAEIASLVKDL